MLVHLAITFFIVGLDAAEPRNHAALRQIPEAGHEIGNHTIAHPCNLNTDPTLISWTLDMIEADVRETKFALGTSESRV